MREILLIDDDECFRGMLFKLLSRNGYAVVACNDGREGVELFRKNPEFLVITDLIMPGQEGIGAVVRQINVLSTRWIGMSDQQSLLVSDLELGQQRPVALKMEESGLRKVFGCLQALCDTDRRRGPVTP
jgi:CheY-like chemotaxis protein